MNNDIVQFEVLEKRYITAIHYYYYVLFTVFVCKSQPIRVVSQSTVATRDELCGRMQAVWGVTYSKVTSYYNHIKSFSSAVTGRCYCTKFSNYNSVTIMLNLTLNK